MVLGTFQLRPGPLGLNLFHQTGSGSSAELAEPATLRDIDMDIDIIRYIYSYINIDTDSDTNRD